jgi:hypothetical protein
MRRYVEARGLPERDSSSTRHTHKSSKKPKSEVSSPLVAKKDVSAPSTYAASVAPVAHALPPSKRTSHAISGTVAAAIPRFASSTTSEVLESERGVR